MANFPRAEFKIQSLAHEIVAGLQAHTDLYPSPPISTEDLDKALAAYTGALDAAIDLQAQAEHATATKDEALQTLVDDMKMVLRYAENVTHYDDASLKFLGWAGPPWKPRARVRAGSSWTGRNPATAVLSRPTRPNDERKVRKTGWTWARPSKPRSPSPASRAASASSSTYWPSTRPGKARRVMGYWRCFDAARR
uniref:Uncharacterized protein n=1 Tax=Candidatus Kentrum sp. FM TaxID=2126340 RepID=A0A450TM09_9GAMM|nr:MAG: hypothetical protein BECKFM1743C_GA0114222_104444 [Candidatus Kentron sp. FM]VFJ68746.1 MAG: hypothetical protein BECKFM1743A_GA0114220_104823 [Candidatus Kentron sp. FM]VFK17130.1 MAG: hypothetical protein BECKFM1743B_GA0114221_104623 [Candidatus Kentron sp. FM]